MPFTAAEIQEAGKIGLDFYLKNNPVDQVSIDRPLLKWLQENKKPNPGAKQYIVVTLRYRYQSNFQWFNGAQIVTYNRRQSIEQANFPWRSAHDGFALDEDRLAQNGIQVTDDTHAKQTSTTDERIQLVNLLQEQTEILRLGFEEQFGRAVHLDGSSSSDAIEGLDKLITIAATGTIGGIDRAAQAWWRNNYVTSLDTTLGGTNEIVANMETQWRKCIRNGGRPNKIIAGSTFIDYYRKFLLANGQGTAYQTAGDERKLEGGTSVMTFKGVPIEWSPEFEDLQNLTGNTWEKRCYFLNSRFIWLSPLQGQDMVTRKPPRAYDKYEYYWGMTWRGGMVMSRSNAHSRLDLA